MDKYPLAERMRLNKSFFTKGQRRGFYRGFFNGYEVIVKRVEDRYHWTILLDVSVIDSGYARSLSEIWNIIENL
jgi:hypothetical protein